MPIVIKKGRAEGKPRPAEVIPGAEPVVNNTVSQKKTGPSFWDKALKDNPVLAARYAEALKRPKEHRAVNCEFCGQPYMLPCENDLDKSTCMNWAYIDGTYEEKFGKTVKG